MLENRQKVMFDRRQRACTISQKHVMERDMFGPQEYGQTRSITERASKQGDLSTVVPTRLLAEALVHLLTIIPKSLLRDPPLPFSYGRAPYSLPLGSNWLTSALHNMGILRRHL